MAMIEVGQFFHNKLVWSKNEKIKVGYPQWLMKQLSDTRYKEPDFVSQTGRVYRSKKPLKFKYNFEAHAEMQKRMSALGITGFLDHPKNLIKGIQNEEDVFVLTPYAIESFNLDDFVKLKTLADELKCQVTVEVWEYGQLRIKFFRKETNNDG